MPTSLGTAAGLEDIVFLPIWFRTKGLPGGRIERWTGNAPPSVREVFIIQLAVIRIHRSFQWTDRVKAFHDLIAALARGWIVGETNASRVSTFEEFSLLTDLS